MTFIQLSGDDVLQGTAPQEREHHGSHRIHEDDRRLRGCAGDPNQQHRLPRAVDQQRDARLASSVYPGCKVLLYHVSQAGLRQSLKFDVKWIGYWFNIPGVTLDPNDVAKSFFDSNTDVVLSGLDTPEALNVAKQYADKGSKVLAVAYDYKDGCSPAPSVCLGVPYFDWGPAYVNIVKAVQAGTWKQSWDWNGPDWKI